MHVEPRSPAESRRHVDPLLPMGTKAFLPLGETRNFAGHGLVFRLAVNDILDHSRSVTT
jgi:hypothetical protein